MEEYILSDGFKIPKIGLGTYQLKGSDGSRRIETALKAGYRLLDSAFNYENEGAVGRAIRNSGVSRDEITFASKLPGRHHEYEAARETIQESLMRSGLEYMDLYLIHWPNPIEDKYVEAWQALVDAQKAGLIRSIGVSNFLPEHIDRLEKETGVLPVINQIELHPYSLGLGSAGLPGDLRRRMRSGAAVHTAGRSNHAPPCHEKAEAGVPAGFVAGLF